MDAETAKDLKATLKLVRQSLDAPMKLAANDNDKDVRRLVRSLASEVISRIEYEILPYLYSLHPNLKAGE